MLEEKKLILRDWLEEQVTIYNHRRFIEDDPIQIPHQFTKLQDIEIIGFWTAILAWGQRPVIIQKAKELVALMDGAPHDFMVNHQEKDRKRWLSFKHRNFNADDTLYFLTFFQQYYQNNPSLESAFLTSQPSDSMTTGLSKFHTLFFDSPLAMQRTKKHVSSPTKGSTCKRLNMFLRWMVRQDACGVDFGIWKRIQPSQLMIPLDVHVDRVARSLGLIERKQTDWLTVEELTQQLRQFDAEDPVKYDFALFGNGVAKKLI
jgi:uncharacterized protein (TIGR02757 family)